MRTPSAALRALAMLTLVALVGCSTSKGSGDDSLAQQTASKERLSVAPMGDKVLGYAIVPDLERSASTAHTLLTRFDPGAPPLLPELLEEVRNAMGWQSVDGLATNKPIKVLVVVNDAESMPEVIALVPIKGEAAFKAQLQQAEEQVAGNALSYETFASPTGRLYVNFINDQAVLTWGPESFAVWKGAIDAMAGARASEGDLVIGFEATNLMRIYGEQFRVQMAQMKELMNTSMGMTGMPMAEATAQNAQAMFSLIERFSEDTDRGEIIVSLDPDLVSLQAVARMKEGSVVRRFLDAQPVGDMSGVDGLPANPGMAMIASIDFDAADGAFKEVANKFMSGLFPKELTETAEFAATLNDLFTHLEPGMTSSTPIDGGFPFASGFVQSFNVSDPKAYRESFLKLSTYYGREDVKAQLLKTYGMTITFQPDVYQLDGVPVDRTLIAYDFSAMEPGMGEFMTQMGMGKPMQFDLICKEKRCIQVQDPADPRARLTNMLKGGQKATPDTDPVKVALARALDKPLFFMFFSYEGIGNMLGSLGLPLGNPLAMFAEGQGLDASINGQGGHFDFKLNVPLKMR